MVLMRTLLSRTQNRKFLVREIDVEEDSGTAGVFLWADIRIFLHMLISSNAPTLPLLIV